MSETQYKVIITPSAEAALEDYDEYLRYELFADQAADTWIDAFEQEMVSLRTFPGKYQLVDREPWRRAGIRFHPVKGQNVYYWISEERRKVYIIDVIGQRMNQDKRLIESLIAFYQDLANGLK